MQETKWKWEKLREIDEGYKITYTQEIRIQEMIVDEKMKRRIVEVARKSDRIIKVKVMLEDKVLNIEYS